MGAFNFFLNRTTVLKCRTIRMNMLDDTISQMANCEMHKPCGGNDMMLVHVFISREIHRAHKNFS